MTVHVAHRSLPSYQADRVWQDGCPACEARADRLPMSITELDPAQFAYAWSRAAKWGRDDLYGDQPPGLAEIKLLSLLWYMQVALERHGVPIGTLPTAV